MTIAILSCFGISVAGQTSAFYDDSEDASTGFSATTLDFSSPSSLDFSPVDIMPGDTASRTINIQKDGELDFQYKISADVAATSTDCDNILIKDDFSASGFVKLTSYVSDVSEFPERSAISFEAKLASNDPARQNKICDFNLKVIGWQKELPDASAGFSDEEIIPSRITTGRWVVINELMWMGSFLNDKDEWVELRNLSSESIDISGWQLTKLATSGEQLMVSVPAGSTIPANGFFLISNFDKDHSKINTDPDLVDPKVNLADHDLQIKLYNGNWQDDSTVLMDTADDGEGDPMAGYDGLVFHFSMERDDDPGDGTIADNWHSCWEDSVEVRSYWKFSILAVNRGTPGGENHSDYDEGAEREKYQYLESQFSPEELMEIISSEALFEGNSGSSAGGTDDSEEEQEGTVQGEEDSAAEEEPEDQTEGNKEEIAPEIEEGEQEPAVEEEPVIEPADQPEQNEEPAEEQTETPDGEESSSGSEGTGDSGTSSGGDTATDNPATENVITEETAA